MGRACHPWVWRPASGRGRACPPWRACPAPQALYQHRTGRQSVATACFVPASCCAEGRRRRLWQEVHQRPERPVSRARARPTEHAVVLHCRRGDCNNALVARASHAPYVQCTEPTSVWPPSIRPAAQCTQANTCTHRHARTHARSRASMHTHSHPPTHTHNAARCQMCQLNMEQGLSEPVNVTLLGEWSSGNSATMRAAPCKVGRPMRPYELARFSIAHGPQTQKSQHTTGGRRSH